MSATRDPDVRRLLVRLQPPLPLLDLILEAPPPALEHRPRADAWCAREHVAHVGRHHEVMRARVRTIVRQTGAVLARYRAEEDPDWERWRALDGDVLRSRLTGLRAALAADVATLSDEQWGHTATHPAVGLLPLARWLDFFLAHEGHHLYAALVLSRRIPA